MDTAGGPRFWQRRERSSVLTLIALALFTFGEFRAAQLAAAPAVLGAIYASVAVARYLRGGLWRGSPADAQA